MKRTGIKDLDQVIRNGTVFIRELKLLLEFFKSQTKEKSEKITYDHKDPYVILGVAEDTPLKEIQRIYRNLVLIYHPDRSEFVDKDKIKEINWAYEQLVKKR